MHGCSLLSCEMGLDTTLNGGTVGDSLVRVDTFQGVFAMEEFLEELLNLGNTGLTDNEDNLNTSSASSVLRSGSVRFFASERVNWRPRPV